VQTKIRKEKLLFPSGFNARVNKMYSKVVTNTALKFGIFLKVKFLLKKVISSTPCYNKCTSCMIISLQPVRSGTENF